MFWENYIRLCNSVEKSPNAVATACGVKSSGTVTGWSNGAKPRKAVLLAIADYFNVSVSDLIGDKQKEKPAPTAEDGRTEELLRLWNKLTPERQEKFLALLQELAKE